MPTRRSEEEFDERLEVEGDGRRLRVVTRKEEKHKAREDSWRENEWMNSKRSNGLMPRINKRERERKHNEYHWTSRPFSENEVFLAKNFYAIEEDHHSSSVHFH
jgi:ribosomal protein L24E